MKYLNAQNVRSLAVEYGKEVRGTDVKVGSDFLSAINEIVEQVVMQAVRSQEDPKRVTLTTNDWMDRQISKGEQLTEEAG